MAPRDKKSQSTPPEPTAAVGEQGQEYRSTALPPEPSDAPSAVEKMSTTIEDLSKRVAKQAELAREQIETNALQSGLVALQRSIERLEHIAIVSTGTGAVPGELGARPCGCGEKPPTCCIELYISRVRVLSGQGLFEGDLELRFAVWALGQCGLVPSLSSYLTISPKGQAWVPVFTPIGKFCVPCNGTLVLPILAEALESGGLLEGKNETGATGSQMAVRCDCDIVPIVLTISLGGTGGSKGGKAEVEVTGRLSEGCCC
jgi:hypothetical protein